MSLRTGKCGREAERGSVLAVSAFGMLAFLLAVGLCVDISHFYVVRAELQNAADAASLAGASALNSHPGGIDEAVVRATTAMNSYDLNNLDVEIDDSAVRFAANFDGPYLEAGDAKALAGDIRFVKVEVVPKEVASVFSHLAREDGRDSLNIAAEATAGMSMPPNVFCDWVPLAVIDDPDNPTLKEGEEYTIRGGPHGSVSPGNRQILAVDGSGASVARENLARGVRTCAEPGHVYNKDTKPGVDAGPVRDGLNTRFGVYSAGMDWEQFPPDANVKEDISWEDYDKAVPDSDEHDDPNFQAPPAGMVGVKGRRIIILPVVDIHEFDEGRDEVHFWKFVAFFLKSRVPGGSGGDIKAEYIGERLVFGKGGYKPGGGPVNPQLAQPVLYR